MITIVTLLTFLGFYALYSASKRAVLNSSSINGWVQKQGKSLKPIGIVLLIIGLILTIYNNGLASGIFYWSVIIMTVASLIIILSPLKILNYKALLITFVCFVLFENFIF